MTQQELAQPSMYCRQCGYALFGLSENRCPECGRPFDPADSGTFLRYPHGYQRRRWIKRIALAVTAVVLLAAIFVAACSGWVYWRYHADWQAEQQAIAALEAEAGPGHMDADNISLRAPGPVCWATARLGYLRDRIWNIRLSGHSQSQVNLAHLAAFRQCTVISLRYRGITDDQLRHLGGMKQLERLFVQGNPAITDAGLQHLTGLANLDVLFLDNTAVTDAGLKHLEGLSNLTGLYVRGTKVTSEGVWKLKEALPSVHVEGP